MEEGEDKQAHKSHRDRHSGRKADKKKTKNVKEEDQEQLTPKQRNPKAFAVQNAVKAERRFRRTMDVRTKRQHIPTVDHTPLEPPPIIVAIVGPPKVGKSTLLRCLIKNFTRQNMSDIKGPVTIVTGKKRRLTFFECNNDMNNMIDISKVADLVLLLVDASFGFEMETFEFLNICQAHGFPRIMGVLTHLDVFRNVKQLRKTKKTLKHRFWTEIYPGAKLFHLSGMVHDEYQRTEIHNLGRFISIIKFRPLQFRVGHPYILTDRFEDLTDPEKIRQNPKCNRTICFYGYTRGANFKNQSAVHIPGCGDFCAKDVSFLPDPCPLPDKEKKRSLNEKEKLIYAPLSGVGGIVYDKDAVYIELGGSHSHSTQNETDMGPLNELVSSLVDSQHTLDTKIAASSLQIFKGAAVITSEEAERNPGMVASLSEIPIHSDAGLKRRKVKFAVEDEDVDDDEGEGEDEDDNDDDDDEGEDEDEDEDEADASQEHLGSSDGDTDDNGSEDELDNSSSSTLKRKHSTILPKEKFTKKLKMAGKSIEKKETHGAEGIDFDDDTDGDCSDDEIQEEGMLKWKVDLVKKAADAFYRRQKETPNLRRLVYGNATESQDPGDGDDDDEAIGGLFRIAREKNRERMTDRATMNVSDCSKFVVNRLQDWQSDEVQEKIKDCFVTGKWKDSEDASTLLEKDAELYGDFEDLETGETHKGRPYSNNDDFESNDEDDLGSLDEGEGDTEQTIVVDPEKSSKEKRLAKKQRLKEMFNSEYDDNEGETSYYDDLKAELNVQSQLNKSEFVNMDDDTRVHYEGYRPGMYIRVEIENIPCELVTNFDPSYPLILGGLLSGESNIGFVQVRLKKHRWYNKILKTRDPLIFSLGWRRFQTIPLFSIQDHNGRNRLLKYTPEHLHCVASFWGPITPQGNGFIAIQNVADVTANFRVAASGVVTELDKSTEIVKKLKLTGVPYKIFKKTAFIKGMFGSILEVSKFEGAAIRTVSGIRGQIKKAERNPEGGFRGTFEDKILLSDIVFMRTWYKVQVPQFYNLVISLLLPPEEKAKWRGMKTVGQLRREQGITIPFNEDSSYRRVVRTERFHKPLMIPKALQKDLPYKSKPKVRAQRTTPALQQQRLAVIREPHEKKVSQMMKMIKTVYHDKQIRERSAMRQRVDKHKQELAAADAKSNQKQKEIKRQIFRVLGKMEVKKNKSKH